MLSISIGPLAFPAAPLLLLCTGLFAAWLARRLAGTAGAAAEWQVWLGLVFGLLAARAVHLGLNAEPYLAQPASALDVRDGGWFAPAGWIAGGAWLGWQMWHRPALRRALAIACTTGGIAWGAGTLALQAAGSARLAPQPSALTFDELGSARSVSLAQIIDGRPAAVNLWATWCGPCRSEMPAFARVQRERGDLRIVFVNQGEAAATVQAYLQRESLALREVWLDPDRRLGAAAGTAGLPTTLFFDGAGRFVDAHFGVLNEAALRSRLGRLSSSRSSVGPSPSRRMTVIPGDNPT